MRWKRRRLLWRALRARRALASLADRTAEIRPADVLLFATIRDEADRLAFFLDHYRRLGVSHFLIVDHGSSDGGTALLAQQPDVSLWSVTGDYRTARFGLDWIGGLLLRYGHRHWCLTVDADEILVYRDWDTRALPSLCADLERDGMRAMGALMLDLYPKGALSDEPRAEGTPLDMPLWFDPGPFRTLRKPRDHALRLQGGARERAFFADTPERSPTLNKLPLVKWDRSYVYTNSTHALLPPKLNLLYDGPGDARPCGALLHLKFLPGILKRARVETRRRAHFERPELFEGYYDTILDGPSLWCPGSVAYEDWHQLVALGLMSGGSPPKARS